MSFPLYTFGRKRFTTALTISICALAVTLLLIAPLNSARAGNTWQVDKSYSSSSCNSDNLRCSSLKDAVAAAESGDIIRITAARYDAESDILIEDKNLTIIGAGQPRIITLPGGNGTIIDETSGTWITAYSICPNCSELTSPGRVLKIKNSTVSFSGMWITAGNSHGGQGGAVLNEGGTITFTDCKIQGQSEGGQGGAVYNGQGTISFTDADVTGINGSFQFSGPAGSDGGAIYNDRGTLHLTRTTVTGHIGHSNDGNGGSGGGLYNKAGVVTITNSAFQQSLLGFADDGNMPGSTPNRTGFSGGRGAGIFNEYPGKVTITDSEIRSNQTGGGGSGGDGGGLGLGSGHPGGDGGAGGGIYNEGEMTITGSTIAGNKTGDGGVGGSSASSPGSGSDGGLGGGIYNGGDLTIINSTVSDNATGGGGKGGGTLTDGTPGGNGGSGARGGGIYNQNKLTLINVTVSGNTTGGAGAGSSSTVSTGSSGRAGSGGGIVSNTSASDAATNVLNTIVAGNTTASGGSFPDVLGTFNSLGHNLVGVNSEHNFNAAGDQAGTSDTPLDAKLDSRKSNGGPTSTYDLLDGSPAINAGDDSVTGQPSNLTYDQRGLGYIRKYNGSVDIGAVEKQPPSNAPVARCQSIIVSAQNSCQYPFSASEVDGGSYDPDAGDSLTLTTNQSGPFGLGSHNVTLTVADDRGLYSTCEAVVTVVDDVPPTITVPPDRLFTTGPGATLGGVVLNNLDSSLGVATAVDNCSTLTPERTGVPAGNFFPIGSTTLTYEATDAKGNKAMAEQKVTVIDNTAPTISGASVSPSVIWPPNGKMIDVVVSYNAVDNSGTIVTGLSISSNEQTSAGSMLVLDNHRVRLRAERADKGKGRIYTIVITATDPYGNSFQQSVTVTVPHDKGK